LSFSLFDFAPAPLLILRQVSSHDASPRSDEPDRSTHRSAFMQVDRFMRYIDGLDIGIKILGFSTICFGISTFLQGDFAVFWQPVPDGFPARQFLAWLSTGLLILTGLGLFFASTRRASAAIQTFLFFAYALAWISRFFTPPGGPGPILGLSEQLAISLAAATLWVRLSPGVPATGLFAPRIALALFGCFSIVFGLAHIIGVKATAAMVPAWMPGGQEFWAIATGIGHLATGIALIADRLAVLATRIAALMYFCFAALSWVPGAVTHPDQWLRWAGVAISLVLMAAVWLIGEYRLVNQVDADGA
jgi:uncharacterized membrane protein